MHCAKATDHKLSSAISILNKYYQGIATSVYRKYIVYIYYIQPWAITFLYYFICHCGLRDIHLIAIKFTIAFANKYISKQTNQYYTNIKKKT